MKFDDFFKECRLCPRECKADRTNDPGSGKTGFCGQGNSLKIGYIGPHSGEEPPISGDKGSGTIFFSGCSLRCSFCQNYQISREGSGKHIDFHGLYSETRRMISHDKVLNINFVTPDHFFPYAFRLVQTLREEGIALPAIYNTSGYQSVHMLKIAEEFADIYLPDFKYSDQDLAKSLSHCPDYPSVALEAVSVMVRQKGFLDSVDPAKPAKKGVLVRHLILPGYVKNSLDVLTSLFLEFGPDLPISIMTQYHPVTRHKDLNLNRKVFDEEFETIYQHAGELGFRNMFIQFPEKEEIKKEDGSLPYLPDFNRESPFRGNKSSY